MTRKTKTLSLEELFNTPEARQTHREVAEFIALVQDFQYESRKSPVQIGPCNEYGR